MNFSFNSYIYYDLYQLLKQKGPMYGNSNLSKTYLIDILKNMYNRDGWKQENID